MRKQTNYLIRMSCFGFYIISIFSAMNAASAEADVSLPGDFVYMSVKELSAVHRGANQNTVVFAKVEKDAVVKVRLHRKMADCREGWFERSDGGFICGRHLVASDADAEKPGGDDRPNLRSGLTAVVVTAKKTPVYKKRKSLTRKNPDSVLLGGSVLTVESKEENLGKMFYKTRRGWFVPAEDCTLLPSEISSLAFDVSGTANAPGAVVIGKEARVYPSPNLSSSALGTLERWSMIPGSKNAPIEVIGEFVKLKNGSYVPDTQLARFRPAPHPEDIEPNERWIAVDLQEQLLTAYEGNRPVRIMPCSTGMRGNTKKGQYRISRKLKQQTMELRMSRIRTEDVQWVMYYDEKDAIAVHSAYWHDDFGVPVSHGCVNLPPDDARWLFDWTAPKTSLTDSITVPLPRRSGTKIVVF